MKTFCFVIQNIFTEEFFIMISSSDQVKKTFSGLIPLENSELCLHSDRLILQKSFTAEDSMNTGLQRPLQVMVSIFFHLWDIKTNDLLTCSPPGVQQRQQ